MKLTQEEREKYKAEFLSDYSIDIPNGHITEDAADYWLSKIDTILEERVGQIKWDIEKVDFEPEMSQIEYKLKILNLPSLK